MQLFLLVSQGINTNGEAVPYHNEAMEYLQTGHFSEVKYNFYAAYIFLHVLFIKLNCETVGIYLVQLLVNLLAMFLFYKTVLDVGKKTSIAFISTLILAVCYSWQIWTTLLYTESIFCSLIIIFSFLLFGKSNIYQNFFAAFVFLMILLSRPTGIFFIPVLCFVLAGELLFQRKIAAAAIIIVLFFSTFFYLINYAMHSGSGFDFIKPLVEKHVICDIPVSANVNSNAVPVQYNNTITGICNYIFQNPFEFAKLAGKRFISFWGMTRPYYTAMHNLFFICFFYPLYFFAIVGLMQLKKTNPVFVIYISSVFLIFTLSVMLTCNDWNNRFNMPVIPFIIMPAGFGIYYLYKKIAGRNSKTG